MEDIRIKITADSDVKTAQNDLSELLKANNELIKSINSLRETMDAKANQAKRSTEEEIGLINKLKASIQSLTDARNKSLNTSEIESYNKKIQQQTTELQKLTSVQQQSTVLTKEQNAQIQSLTGNAEKSNGMFKNLAITLGAMFAADRIIDYTKSLFDATIAAERQNIALKNISATNEEYANSIGFLNEITNKYGQSINSVRESYVGFIAASKSSNLALGERQKIYESIIQAGSTLQLSNDKIERSLNAVSQMFSKGNVSAEELRQQLGESLPGAFGIMAKALNVNEKQLNKMLEQGEVLAKDALPKFGAALTELYGDKAQNNVNTWAGGLNRATNSIIAWSQRTNESIGLTRKMADAANWLADNLDSVINAILAMSAAIAVNTLKTIANTTVKQVQLVMLGREVLAKQAASVVTLELTAAETAAAAAATRLNTVMASAPWGIAMIAITAVVGALLEYNDAQKQAYLLTESGIKATDETIKQERIHQEELKLTIERTKGLMYGTAERRVEVEKLMQAYPQYFKNLSNEQVSNWHLENAYRQVNTQIERKIELMAKEKRAEAITNRLVELKLKLDESGTGTDLAKYLEKVNKTMILDLSQSGRDIKEYNRLLGESQKAHNELGKAQTRQINEELQLNRWKLDNGKITEKQFKDEVIRINQNYGLKLKAAEQYEKENQKIINSGVDSDKKANKEKLSDFEKYMAKKSERESKYFEDAKKDMDKSVDSYIKALKKQNEDESKAQKDLIKEKEERKDASFKKMQQSLLLEKVANATTLEQIEELQKEHIQTLLNYDLEKLQSKLKIQKQELLIAKSTGALYLEEELKRKKDIEKTETEILDLKVKINGSIIENKKDALKKEADLEKKNADYVADLWGKTLEETEKQFEKRQKTFEYIFEASFDAVSQIVDEFYRHLDKKSKEGETSAERQGAALNKAFLEPFKENVNAAKALISGDYVGAAKGLYGYFEGIWKVTIGFRNTLKEININEFNIQWESTMANLSSYSEQIKENFEGLADASVEFNQVQKTGVDALIQAEIDRAGKIRDTYDMAMSKEDELFNKRIKNINDEYSLKDALANQRFDADSLAIQENLNNGLLALLTNEESKTSITSDYASRRSTIMQQFALADSDITEKTTQAERDAINAAIEARTKALAELESWYTTELEFTINSEGQKRKEYTATAQLIKDAADAQNVLDNQFAADAIVREGNKQIAIEAEKKRHDDEQIRLEEVKNSALLSSFNALKDAMKAGYSEILAAANEAYTSGLITANEYLSKLKEINALRGLVGEGTPNLNQDIRDRLRSLGIPGFNEGAEKVGGNKGIDKNLALLSYDEGVMKGDLNTKRLDAGLNMSKTVEYAINYKNMLSDSSYVPLEFKPNLMQKLDERMAMQYLLNMNMQPVIEELQAVKMVIKNMPQTEFKIKDGEISKIVRKGNSVQVFKSSMFD